MSKPQFNITVKGEGAFTAYYATVNGTNYAKPPLYEIIEIVDRRCRRKHLGECHGKEEFINQIELHQARLKSEQECQKP